MDLDVYDKVVVEVCGGKLDLVDVEYCEGGFCFVLVNWMDVYLVEYGFLWFFLENNGGVVIELWYFLFVFIVVEFEVLCNFE